VGLKNIDGIVGTKKEADVLSALAKYGYIEPQQLFRSEVFH